MAFRPLTGEDGKTISVLATNGVTFTKHCGVKLDSVGTAGLADSGDPDVQLVSLEAKTIANTTTQLLCLKVDSTILFECDIDTAVDATEVGDAVDITNSTHLAAAASTDDAFLITGIVPSCTTKVRGYFQAAIADHGESPS